MKQRNWIKLLALVLRITMVIQSGIGIAMVTRRLLILKGQIRSFNPAGGPPFDQGFTKHPIITSLHIIPGAIFMILCPALFLRGLGAGYKKLSGSMGKIFLISSYTIGISALCIPFIMLPIGGINEATASMFFGLYFLLSLSTSLWYYKKDNIVLYRQWMIRTIAIGLAITTVRPIMVLFFAFSHQAPGVFFGTAFWLGFTLHLIGGEIWINCTRPMGNH